MKYFLPIIIFGVSFVFLFIYFYNQRPKKVPVSDRMEIETEVNMAENNIKKTGKLTTTTLFDNYQYKNDLKTGHGFSC